MKKIAILFIVFQIFVGNLSQAYQQKYGSQEPVPFYKYEEDDLDELSDLQIQKEGSKRQVEFWTEYFSKLSYKYYHECTSASLVYLLTAQRDVILLSQQLRQKNADLDPISYKLALLFYPEAHHKEMDDSDPFSQKIAEIVYEKYEKRFQREQRQAHTYAENDSLYREGYYPKKELRLERCVPWLITPVYKFRSPPPPEQSNQIFWQTQMNYIIDIQKNLSEAQIAAVKKWANGDQLNSPGHWLLMGLDYIFKQDISLPQTSFIASVYAQGLFNASIAIFDSKYAYLIKRPSIIDKHVKEIIPNPITPSYPSGHAAYSTAGANLLNYFFPQSENKWTEQAIETSLSRVWGGIHTPYDVDEGIILGTKVSKAFLEKIYLQNE